MKQISKKVLSLALAAVLSLSLCVVALAEESTPNPGIPGGTPSTGNPDVGPSENPGGTPSTEDPGTPDPGKDTVVGDLSKGNTLSSATVSGNNIMDKVTLKTVSTSFFETMSSSDRVKSIFNNAGIAFDKADYLASVDITYGGEIPKSGITFTFNVNGVTKNDIIYAIHQKRDGTYEIVKCLVPQDGKVSITLYTLSPVAFFKVEGAKSTTSTAAKKVLSPKTGEF